ncbi:hypothetical protein, partial [Pseudomonas viridiflava]|uniref:hypothetical protein n=1 Tax=Pseudomonas viridiflava TaxID=33069 RepID=UPI001980D2E7
PGTDRRCTIDAKGSSIIITSINGSGKTQLLKTLYNFCELSMQSTDTIDSLQAHFHHLNAFLSSNSKVHQSYESHVDALKFSTIKLDHLKNPPITIKNLETYIQDYRMGESVLLLFEATRQANFREASSATSKEKIIQQAAHTPDTSSYFEDYLVSQITLQAYAESPNIGNDPSSAKTIAKWFEKLEADFKNLFEDPT